MTETLTGDVKIYGPVSNELYQRELLSRLDVLSVLNERREKDYLLLSGYVLDNANAEAAKDSAFDIFAWIIQMLEQIYQMMHSEITFQDALSSTVDSAVANFNEGRNASMELFIRMIDPLLIALEKLQNSVFSQMGIDYIPIVPRIREILLNIKKIAEVLKDFPASDVEEANKNAGNSFVENSDDNVYNRLIEKIRDTFYKALEIIQKIIACVVPFLLMMLIEKLKPVADSFGFTLGQIYQIAMDVYTVAKLLIYNQEQLIDMFIKVLRTDLDELWNLAKYYIGGMKLPADGDIMKIVKDIVSCDFDMENNQMRIDLIKAAQELYSKKQMIDALGKANVAAGAEQTNDLYAAVNEHIPSEIADIKESMSTLEKNFESDFAKKCEILYAQNVILPTKEKTPPKFNNMAPKLQKIKVEPSPKNGSADDLGLAPPPVGETASPPANEA